jgi:hypothetical protein
MPTPNPPVNRAHTILEDTRIWQQTRAGERRCRLVLDPKHPRAPRRRLDPCDVLIQVRKTAPIYLAEIILTVRPRKAWRLGEYHHEEEARAIRP